MYLKWASNFPAPLIDIYVVGFTGATLWRAKIFMWREEGWGLRVGGWVGGWVGLPDVALFRGKVQ